MEKLIRKSALIALMTMVFACSAMAEKPVLLKPNAAVSIKPCLAGDFRINVQTDKDIYRNRDILRLTVQLLNNSPRPVSIGLRPVKPVPAEVNGVEIEDVFEGFLDGRDVDVAIIPYRPRIIGYATLTRLGPSPVPYLVPYAEEIPIAKPVLPRKIRLPLFGSPRVAGHSTRIISTANILLACPLLEAEAIPLGAEPAEITEAEEIETIPAIARYIALRPGYYLLDCRINKIRGTKSAQAQKIIQIRRRLLKPIPVPKPIP